MHYMNSISFLISCSLHPFLFLTSLHLTSALLLSLHSRSLLSSISNPSLSPSLPPCPFSLFPSPSLSHPPSHRVLRHTVFICASRSLSVRATACRSNTLPEEEEEERNGSMLVFVDVENINSVSSTGMRTQACYIYTHTNTFHCNTHTHTYYFSLSLFQSHNHSQLSWFLMEHCYSRFRFCVLYRHADVKIWCTHECYDRHWCSMCWL